MDRRLARLWKRWTQPIDWEAVAVEQHLKSGWRRTRKGDKRPKEDVERGVAIWRRNKERRQRGAVVRSEAVRRAEFRAKGYKARGEARMAILAACDIWMTRRAIREATGLCVGTVKGVVWHAAAAGLLDQREIAQRAESRWIEPTARYEYRVTARGKAELAWLVREFEPASGEG